MKIIKWLLVLTGGLAAAIGLTCAFLGYEQASSRETWTVRIPGGLGDDGAAVAAVRGALLGRASVLMGSGDPSVHYDGEGVFTVRLSPLKPGSELISGVLAAPGRFSIKAQPPEGGPCADSAPAVVAEHSVEQAALGFNSDGAPVVSVRLTGPAGKSLRAHSRQNIGAAVDVCLDGDSLMRPSIRTEVGSFLQIDGFDSTESALRVAAILNGGPIPVGAVAERDGAA